MFEADFDEPLLFPFEADLAAADARPFEAVFDELELFRLDAGLVETLDLPPGKDFDELLLLEFFEAELFDDVDDFLATLAALALEDDFVPFVDL